MTDDSISKMHRRSPLGIPCLTCHAKTDVWCVQPGTNWVTLTLHPQRLKDYNHILDLSEALRDREKKP